MAVAVVTGAHPIDVRAFQRGMEAALNEECVFQSLYEFGTDTGSARDAYDLVVFYHWHLETPLAEPREWWQKGTREALESLGGGQGLILLHHSIVAFPEWDTWDRLSGFTNRADFSYHQDQLLEVSVVDGEHPITAGISDFIIEDEAYRMASPDPTMVIPILTCGHELSMDIIAWTHTVRDSRVFCMQLGHGKTAYEHQSFRQLLGNAATWVRGIA